MMWWWGEEGRRGYTKVPSGEIPGASSVSSESESGSWRTGCERDKLYKYCVYYIWWDSFQGRKKNIFLCKAICKIHICHLRNLQFLLYILYDGNCLYTVHGDVY